MRTVEGAADPQTEAAARLMAWITRGRPDSDDLLRLALMTLLPQLAGVLAMVARTR
jgi:hypothetical protein